MNGRSDLEIVRLLVGPDATATEANLASSILHSRRDWESQAKLVTDGVEVARGEREWALLKKLVDSCSETTLSHYCCHWTNLFTKTLKVTTDPAVHQQLCGGVSSLVAQARACPRAVPDFVSKQLPSLLQGLLWFSSSAPPLQVPAIRAAAHCHAHFTSGHAQHRHALLKWAESAVFHCYGPLSLEGARLMVLLCCHSNQKWVALVDSIVSSLEWTLNLLHMPSKTSSSRGLPSAPANSTLELPLPLPNSDPERTATLLQLLDQLARTLTSSLLLPPKDHTHPPSVPVEKILGVVFHGLGQGLLTGHTTECLVVNAALPVIHTYMWNILSSLVRTCHSHLYPYAMRIRMSLVDEICSADESPLLLAAIYRTMTLWVGVAKDYDASFINPVLAALLLPKSHAPSRLLQLEALCDVVEHVGPALPHASSLLSAIQRLPFEMLTPSTRPDHACCLLSLLMACVRSRNPMLAPPLGPVLQLLVDVAEQHQDQQVLSICLSATTQCSLLTHPSIVPLTTLPPRPSSPTNSPLPSLPLHLHTTLHSTPPHNSHFTPNTRVGHASTQTTPPPSFSANDINNTRSTIEDMSTSAEWEETRIEVTHKRIRSHSSDIDERDSKKRLLSDSGGNDPERDVSDPERDVSSGGEDYAAASGAELFVDESSDSCDDS